MSSPERPWTARRGTPARPGSLLWLLRMQLRVSWRVLLAQRSTRILALVAVGLLVFGAVAAAPWLWQLRGPLAALGQLQGPGLLLAGAITLLVFLLMLSAAISATLEALYERGDLDLLLGAPLRPRTVLASRLLGVAVSAGTLYGLLAVPVVVFALVAGLWRLLGLLPWLLSLSLLAASLAGLITLGLVRLIGVRRARTAASIVGALSGAAFFIVTQLQNLRGREVSGVVTPELLQRLQQTLQGGGPLGEGSALWYPARALWLEPLPTLTMLAAAAVLFGLSVTLLEGAFQRGAQQAGMHGRAAPRGRRSALRPLHFRSGALAVLIKEWRLLARDPLLLSRILLQLVYLVPLGFVLLRQGGAGQLVGGAGILALGSLATSLALITTNGEEAPDLLLSAPQSLTRLRWLRLWAATLPVLGLWLLLSAAGLWHAPGLRSALGALLGLWAVLGSALIVLWRPMEVRRADLFRRGGQRGDLLMTVSTLLLQGGLMLALFLLPTRPQFGSLGLLLALVAPLLAMRRGRAARPQQA
ncbi:hypothetical protein [Deinococcus sonorensis]|uniref:ABC transporter permease n=2 Tax=Deinococcus sonorensis TaxID=309891 RepID=A0AAU7U8F6_9DEIO